MWVYKDDEKEENVHLIIIIIIFERLTATQSRVILSLVMKAVNLQTREKNDWNYLPFCPCTFALHSSCPLSTLCLWLALASLSVSHITLIGSRIHYCGLCRVLFSSSHFGRVIRNIYCNILFLDGDHFFRADDSLCVLSLWLGLV